MPRSFSICIQSVVALRLPRRARTSPASWMAPPYSSSFSVRVVLPASGWAQMANDRREFTSVSKSTIGSGTAITPSGMTVASNGSLPSSDEASAETAAGATSA